MDSTGRRHGRRRHGCTRPRCPVATARAADGAPAPLEDVPATAPRVLSEDEPGNRCALAETSRHRARRPASGKCPDDATLSGRSLHSRACSSSPTRNWTMAMLRKAARSDPGSLERGRRRRLASPAAASAARRSPSAARARARSAQASTVPASLDDGVARVESSIGRFVVAGLPIEAPRERARGAALEAGVAKQALRPRTRRAARPPPPGIDAGPSRRLRCPRPRRLPVGAVAGERSHALELLDRRIALPAIAKYPGKLARRRRRRARVHRAPRAHATRGPAGGWPRRACRAPPAGRPAPARRAAPGRRRDERRRVEGGTPSDIRGRRLVHDRDARRRLTEVRGAQAFEKETRAAGGAPRRVEQLLVRGAVVVVDEHH